MQGLVCQSSSLPLSGHSYITCTKDDAWAERNLLEASPKQAKTPFCMFTHPAQLQRTGQLLKLRRVNEDVKPFAFCADVKPFAWRSFTLE